MFYWFWGQFISFIVELISLIVYFFSLFQCFSSIVGPNGSGKSNVIDSMLFVFGYRARRIRSKSVAILIHNSQNHQNITSCSVSVHFQKIIDLVSYELVNKKIYNYVHVHVYLWCIKCTCTLLQCCVDREPKRGVLTCTRHGCNLLEHVLHSLHVYV